jgi:hypothetical protein
MNSIHRLCLFSPYCVFAPLRETFIQSDALTKIHEKSFIIVPLPDVFDATSRAKHRAVLS